MQGLDWQTVQIPLVGGVNQKADSRALQQPANAIASDIQWEEHGGVQTRHPFVAITGAASIYGGGSITTARRIERNGEELVLFTKDAVYSRLSSQSSWILRGAHLAVALEERRVFSTSGDQRDSDRAELANVIIVAWVDASGLWVAAEDKTTGAVLMSPTLANAVGTRPRLVALSTKILLFWVDTAASDIECIAIDPAAPATAVAGAATTVFAASNLYYDVVKIPGADTVIGANRRTVTTSYEVWKVTQALAVSTSTKARTCDGPIALSCDPTGGTVQIVRANSTNIQGDRLTVSTLADAATGQAVGTASSGPTQIAAAHRSVQDSGAYRCYVFWNLAIPAGTFDPQTKFNYVDTAGGLGTEAVFGASSSEGVASRAFDYDGRVYVWLAFAGQSLTGTPAVGVALQNTYFLLRDDALLVAKAAATHGGGFPASTGRLPNVALVSGSTGFAWCGTARRIVALGGSNDGYGARAPLDITFTFDDNRARRCARLGLTFYIAGAQPLQFDGVDLTEIGFNTFPIYMILGVDTGTGNVADGTYTYVDTWACTNARGESDRSSTATYLNVTMAGGPGHIGIDLSKPPGATRRTTAGTLPRRDVWRTAVNPGSTDAPLYMVTSRDPSAVDPNGYQPATDVTMTDALADADLTVRESFPENGAFLEYLAPPPCTIIAAHGSRLFLGGVAGEPRRIRYSRLRGDGEVASFHDALTVELPPDGGDLVAIAVMPDGIPIAFCETAVFAIPGDGFDNTGGGANYGPARAISYDVGCRDHDSVAVTPAGIVFHSAKGKYLLTRGYTMQYIGAAVSDHDGSAVLAAHVLEDKHQVRFVTSDRLLVYDYIAPSPEGAGQWSTWPSSGSVHATIWNGTHHILQATGPLAEQSTYTGTSYGIDLEVPWIKPADLQGAIRLRKMKILGEWRSTHWLKAQLSYNYNTTVVDTKVWSPTMTVAGQPLEVEIVPSIEQCQAVKARFTVLGTPTQATLLIDAVPTDLDNKVTLRAPVSDWTATLTARSTGTAPPLGDLGNDLSLSFGFISGTTALIEVRDHRRFDATTGRWSTLANNIGVRVVGNDTTAPVTVAAVEARINALSRLASVTAPHATPTACIDFSAMATMEADGDFSGGAFAAATGESLKLTGLALEIGLKRGIYKRLPASQRI